MEFHFTVPELKALNNALERDLWYFLTDLILDLSLERQSEYNEDISF